MILIIICVIFGLILAWLGWVYISFLNHKDVREYEKEKAQKELESYNKLPRRVRRKAEQKSVLSKK